MASPPFKVKAIYEYTSPHDDDLHFPLGQVITVTEEEDDDWYSGEYVDASGVKQEGIFPRNFVEKYEPTAPPRPTRTSRPKKEAEPAPAPIPEPVSEPAPAPIQHVEDVREEEPQLEPEPVQEAAFARRPSPPAPKVESVPPPQPRVVEAAPPIPSPKQIPPPAKSSPPPVSEKPTGNSFRDRIAAFEKAKAAPPPTPFKPGGLGSGGSNNFIKKPFVAPPPSKNAYIPPPREPVPQKLYRRDEDPEIAARELENQRQAEEAGLAPGNADDEEEQPKPTSLKERIALLQKQQMEQASRHADAAAKKEKPKRPAKKRTESHNTIEGAEEGEGATLEKKDTEENIGKPSMDSVREEDGVPRRRKSTKDTQSTSSVQPRKSLEEGYEPDVSGAGETTEEPEEISTGKDDSDEKSRVQPLSRAPTAPLREPNVGEEEGATEEPEEEEEEEDIDPEVRRKEELRARMAKMSGGMGMHGMFGAMPMPKPLPPKKKKSLGAGERQSSEYGAEDRPSASTHAPPVPMIPMPGLTRVRSPEEISKPVERDDADDTPVSSSRPADEVPDVEDVVAEPSGAPPVPGGRPAPPPVPKDTRPTPSVPRSPSAGSESDDELSASVVTPKAEASRAPSSPTTKRASFFSDQTSPTTSQGSKDRRTSKVPPIPGTPSTPVIPYPQTRAPPPLPPNAPTPLSRSSTGDRRVTPSSLPKEENEEVTEYDGDYDTDMPSAVPHKEALKAHPKELGSEDNTNGQSPIISQLSAPPPLPPTAPRAVPPPLPAQPPPISRKSVDVPRAAPPPPPASKASAPLEEDDDDYDPYKYTAPQKSPPPVAPSKPISISSPRNESTEEDLYSASPPRPNAIPSQPPQNRAAPPPPPREAPGSSGPQIPIRGAPRQSLDVSRGNNRRSVELSRMSMDPGFVANDVDLGRSSYWWTQPKSLPPIFQNRKDFLYEMEESTSLQNGKTMVTKELFVLYQDYSQTIIAAEFDAENPADVHLEQKHEQPPSRLRQDQLEQAHEQFGRRIIEAVSSKQGTVVGDGTPHGLVQELLKPLANVLLPVGVRGYGAIVYSNLANASTQQNDEIRPGDIITLRNTKFQGKHGTMHAKYTAEVGKPDHVGVVAEWDGTKKKVRAWEQGRESKKVKLESFKLDDLRSGEVKIWRVMSRGWVGWHGH
ncbi:hypothetical protein HYFRA_00004775 [Hymenoscyphus fraxineus]|uniref:SH3 domain-containing protein n=1 Tax=Hymenoscyphus fraxineus TaxID=746836 RepID=A0A9N9KM11_9HELO|nr:hypothetical protein HYFRA_00004775 [Hymenoscyphus fraxineus]